MFQCHCRAVWLLTTEGMQYNIIQLERLWHSGEKCGDLADGFCSWMRFQNLTHSCSKETRLLWRGSLILYAKLYICYYLIGQLKAHWQYTFPPHHTESWELILFLFPTSVMQRAGRCVANNAHARTRTPLHFCKCFRKRLLQYC